MNGRRLGGGQSDQSTWLHQHLASLDGSVSIWPHCNLPPASDSVENLALHLQGGPGGAKDAPGGKRILGKETRQFWDQRGGVTIQCPHFTPSIFTSEPFVTGEVINKRQLWQSPDPGSGALGQAHP